MTNLCEGRVNTMTIIYEVNLRVAAAIAEEYLSWLSHHIQEMLTQPGFVDASLYEEVAPENCSTETKEYSYIVKYLVKDLGTLERYFQERAPSMRLEGIKRFGEKFTASRRVLKLLGA
jgi:antibiotic biosynthesis monooxygenase (ABM) superfamily enzyme